MENILIVEDSTTINKIITGILKKNSNFNVFSSFSLADAREYLNKEKIDFILLDINLPDGNGYELVEELSFKNVKIFVMTTEDDKQFIEMNYQKGIIEFIVKDKAFVHKAKKLPQKIEKIGRNSNKTILIVDDSSFIRMQLEKLFTNRNYSVVAVANTLDALNVLQKQQVDLILLDIELQNENGIDFLNKHRHKIVDEKAIPVMIVSGYIDDMITKLALKAGAVDVLRKPYVTEEIVLKSDFWIDYNSLNEKVHSLQKEFNSVIKEKQFFETLLDATMEMIFIHDKNLKIIDLNKTAARIVGIYDKEDIVGRCLQEYLYKESVLFLKEHIETNEKRIFEGTLRAEAAKDVLIKTESFISKKQEFFITSLLDISEIKQKEAQLIQQSKLAQMGEMLSMIAHQWRQPLNIIATINEILVLKSKKEALSYEQVASISKKIGTQINYLSKTIDDFKEYFKPQKQPKAATVEDIIFGIVELVEASIANNKIEITLELNSQAQLVTYVNELQQALINIVKNAEDALKQQTETNRKIFINTFESETFSVIEIEDNAGGIDAEVIPKIFDPYFSTKGEKNGTGLGLYMAKTIIEKHCQGSLSIENTAKGAKFIIKLPNKIV